MNNDQKTTKKTIETNSVLSDKTNKKDIAEFKKANLNWGKDGVLKPLNKIKNKPRLAKNGDFQIHIEPGTPNQTLEKIKILKANANNYNLGGVLNLNTNSGIIKSAIELGLNVLLEKENQSFTDVISEISNNKTLENFAVLKEVLDAFQNNIIELKLMVLEINLQQKELINALIKKGVVKSDILNTSIKEIKEMTNKNIDHEIAVVKQYETDTLDEIDEKYYGYAKTKQEDKKTN